MPHVVGSPNARFGVLDFMSSWTAVPGLVVVGGVEDQAKLQTFGRHGVEIPPGDGGFQHIAVGCRLGSHANTMRIRRHRAYRRRPYPESERPKVAVRQSPPVTDVI